MGWPSSAAVRFFPAPLKRALRAWGVQDYLHARRLAGGLKRLDWCALQLCTLFHLAGLAHRAPLRGKRCLEVGAGWVLSHSLAMHLLGAQSVVATDIAPLARPGALRRSIESSNLTLLPGGILGFFDDRHDVRRRIDRLRAVPRFTFGALADFGVQYEAPMDLLRAPYMVPVDFLFSTCVLEYLPAGEAGRFVQNLAASLAPGGCMIHYIHLEDHAAVPGQPLAFLSEPGEAFERSGATASRGNRLRVSAWVRLFREVAGADVQVLYVGNCERAALPGRIDPGVEYVSEVDLLGGHLGILLKKK